MSNNPIFSLFITRQVPYPPIGGVSLRNWQNIQNMRQFGSVAVFSIPSDGCKPQVDYLPNVAIWHNYQMAKLRQQRSLMKKIRDRLWWLQIRSHPWANQLYGYTVVQQLTKVLNEYQPQVVIFEEIWLYRYLKIVQNYDCSIIYDAHNVEILLRQDLNSDNQKQKLTSQLESRLLLKQVKAIEKEFTHQANQIWVCSQNDAIALQRLYQPQALIQIIPNAVNVFDYENLTQDQYPLSQTIKPQPHTLIFTALFSHPPNAVAAELLITNIYPLLRKYKPHCRLILAGRNPTHLMKKAAHQNPQIIVTGKVPDIRPYLAAAGIVVVPLLDGSGTRLKILEAFAARRPVVSTSKGAEGLKIRDGEHLLIRDTIEDIVVGICQLWSDENLAHQLADSAYKLVLAKYSWQAVSQSVKKAIAEL